MPHNFANAKRCFEESRGGRGEERKAEKSPVHVLASVDDVLHWTMEAVCVGRASMMESERERDRA